MRDRITGFNFSFLDIETTGFTPQRGDKIIEIGIVTTDYEGNIISSYETLINPKRDIGATWVHGITSDMVVDAPDIKDIVDDILEQLDGNIIVCHNKRFDLQFLNHELRNVLSPGFVLEGVCSLELSRTTIPDLPSHKLGSICQYLDIELLNAHSAYGDALATSSLFYKLIDKIGPQDVIVDELQRMFNSVRVNSRPFISSGATGIRLTRKDSQVVVLERMESLARKISRLPTSVISTKLPVQEYLNILEDVLLDRIITEDESERILEFAESFSITQNEAIQIHEEYLRRLVRIYLLDNVITEAEYSDLLIVSKLLGIHDKLDFIIALEKAEINTVSQISSNINADDYFGKSVCFTGELNSKISGRPIERMLAQNLAMEKGMIIKSSVSKKLDYLVVADPNSQSSKARKAREYGTKIIAEPVFWNMLGINVE